MKNFKNIYTAIILLFTTLNVSRGSNYFVAASATTINQTCSNNVAPNFMGCDDLATTTISTSNEIVVMVRENTSIGETFGWDNFNGTKNRILLQSTDVQFPDVALVENSSNTIYAIIVYYSVTQGGI